MGMTTAFKTALLNHYFQNADHANVGDAAGLQNSTVAGDMFISMHTAFPGDAGSQTTSETTYGSYARQAVARSAAGWATTGDNTDNVAAITFPTATSGSETVFYIGCGSAVSGAGNLFFWGAMGTNKGPFTGLTTDIITIPNHSLAVDERIAFFVTPGAILPTGVVEGTVYWVKTVPDGDTITVSATQGGATLDLTADGNGIAFKMIGLLITAAPAITPKFNIGALDFFAD